MTDAVEEVDFPHTGDPLDEKILTLGKWTFNLGGVVHDFRDVLKRFQEAMKHWNDERGPEDYDRADVDLRNLISRAVREGARAGVEISGGYHESNNGGNQWAKWMIPGLVTLAVMGIGGGIVMFGKLSSLETKVEGVQNQVNDIKKIVEPRYRGTP
jgi:hypothetical protein